MPENKKFLDETGLAQVAEVVNSKARIFGGTRAEWDELSLADKVKYDYTAFEDLSGGTFDLNWLEGKTINFLGDSITKGSWYQGGTWQGYMDNPYPSIIANLLKCTSNNYGESGSPIVHTSGDTGCVDRVGSMLQADVNVLFAGVNDLTGGTLGDKDSTSNTTVYGALKLIAQAFIANNPAAINIFISPLMSTIINGNIRYDEIREAIEYVANQYGFIFIDASVEAPMLQPNNATLDTQWLNGDDCHPNPEYHVILGNWLARKLITYDSSSTVPSCVDMLSEIRTGDYTSGYYLKVQWTGVLSNTSEQKVEFINSYGGSFVLSGNPYYDKNYSPSTGSVSTIRACLLGADHWENPDTSAFVGNVYVTEGAIYIEFISGIAFRPVVTHSAGIGISLEWVAKATYTYDSSTDRNELIQVMKSNQNSGFGVLETTLTVNGVEYTTSTEAESTKVLVNSYSFDVPEDGNYLVTVSNIGFRISNAGAVFRVTAISDAGSITHQIGRYAFVGDFMLSKTFVQHWSKGSHTFAVAVTNESVGGAAVSFGSTYCALTIVKL